MSDETTEGIAGVGLFVAAYVDERGADQAWLKVTFSDGTAEEWPGDRLDAKLTAELHARTGRRIGLQLQHVAYGVREHVHREFGGGGQVSRSEDAAIDVIVDSGRDAESPRGDDADEVARHGPEYERQQQCAGNRKEE